MSQVFLLRKPSGETQVVDVADINDHLELRSLIGCNELETVTFLIENEKYRILLDANSRPWENPDIEVNKEIARRVAVVPISEHISIDETVFGNIIVCKQKDKELCGLDEQDIARIRRHIKPCPNLGLVLIVRS